MDSAMTTEPTLRAGDLLKQGRLKQRLSLSDCSKRTHIAGRYLEAIEDNRWNDLPSESHRRGFLRSYAQFLGVSSEEVMTRYQADHQTPASVETPARPAPAKTSLKETMIGLLPQTSAQWIGSFVFLLVMTWAVYHLFSKEWSEPQNFSWTRMRTPSATPRLTASTVPANSVQRVRIKSNAQSWIRISSQKQLLFEGILPSGAEKQWSGPGPFQLKLGNVTAVEVYWNDQPVDAGTGSQGGVNSFQLPLQR